MPTMIRSVSPTLSALLLGASALWPLQAQAFFGDDEARKAIIDLRQKVDANRQVGDAAATEAREGQAVTRRSLLDLANQLEQLRAEIARLRGQNEQLSREVSELQRQQKDVQTGLDERLRQVEPLRITHDGLNFTAAPNEKRDFDAAMEVLRRSEFEAAATAYAAFLRRYPDSGYTPSSLYWLGNAQYASRAYKEAIESHRRLVTQFPAHLRTPEAMLAMANSQVELKETRAARRTLEELVKAHPESEAAAAGRERLARLR
ncbi:tol-pal system protein YbgF [Hydrogenophaga sp.]|uniref:tol-pal system protein YbgF n=1 Tax=Hydrogenophaga sp. TaxID=1904254 RepID=UPI003F6B7C65